MASLHRRGKTFHLVFRVEGRQVSRSLKTADEEEADFRLSCVKRILYRVETGQEVVPLDVDIVDFILADGNADAVTRRARSVTSLPFAEVTERYFVSRQNRDAATYISSQRTHLRHLRAFLDDIYPKGVHCRQIKYTDLKRFVDHRLTGGPYCD